MQKVCKQFLSVFSAAAILASALPLSAAAAGNQIVDAKYFDPDFYEVLLFEADEDNDGRLDEYELSMVTDLDISGMGITSLKGLQYLNNLSWLDASNNDLRSVSSMGRCPYLTWLDLSGNQISSISGLQHAESLQELNLSENMVRSVQPLEPLKNLETLDLSRNDISSSASFAKLSSLRELVLDDNKLTEIDDLPDSLVYLSARNNDISDFIIVSFNSSLEYLDLSHNSITEIPKMKYMTSLKTCYLNDNDIRSFEGFWNQTDCIMDLSRNRLDTTEQAVVDMVGELRAGDCAVEIIPQSMKGWQKDGQDTYYFLDTNGTFAVGTRTIDGKEYTFDKKGILNGDGGSTTPDSGKPQPKPDPDPDTKPKPSGGWYTDGRDYYYKKADGTNHKGWLQLDGVWYYLDAKSSIRRTGWVKVSDKWYYMDPADGHMITGWLKLDGKTYYLNASGAMLTGSQTIDGKKYVFDASGALIQGTAPVTPEKPDPKPNPTPDPKPTPTPNPTPDTPSPDQPTGSGWVTKDGKKYYTDGNGSYKKGWLKLGSYWYYLDPVTGEMKTGWQQVNMNWFYLDASGIMLVGDQTIDGKKYNFNANGTLNGVPPAGVVNPSEKPEGFPGGKGWNTANGITTYTKEDGSLAYGWLKDGNSWYYLDTSTGAMQTGWVKVGNYSYYMNPETGKMQTGWLKLNEKWYYLNPGSGAMRTGWFKVGNVWYVTDEKGVLLTSQWLDYKGERYYLTPSGGVARNWYQVDKKWYHFNADGMMHRNTWIPTATGNSWCYTGKDGVMATGWQNVGGKRYYMRPSDGYCLVNGWYKIDGKSYYFYKNGQLAVNTTINGYKVGADGAWSGSN